MGSDWFMFARAGAEGRVIVTTNVRDVFRVLWKAADAGEPQTGVILTSDRGLTRNAAGLDAMEAALERVLAAHPDEWALANRVVRAGPYPLGSQRPA